MIFLANDQIIRLSARQMNAQNNIQRDKRTSSLGILIQYSVYLM